MIKATIQCTPTAYTTPFEKNFNSLEDVLRYRAKTKGICVVAIEEEGVGYHLIHLNPNGTIILRPFSGFYENNGKFTLYPTPEMSLKMHCSEKLRQAIANVEAELSTPKLA